MKRLSKEKSFKEQEQEWYARLKKSGFQDIEDVSDPDRRLMDWHSRKFMTERSRARQAARERYNKLIEDFLNSNAINEICTLITKHGNSTIKPKTVIKILVLHGDGLPERKIAKKIRRSKTGVHKILVKAKEWMKVA